MLRKIIFSLGLLLITSPVFAGSWSCSSFFINDEGYIATAGHCVSGGKHLGVMIGNIFYPATLIAADYSNDVAIVKVKYHSSNYLKFNMASNVEDTIYILGYPIPDVRGNNLKIKRGSMRSIRANTYLVGGGSCEGNSGGVAVNSNNDAIGVVVAGYGSPCSYWVILEKISHVANLAMKYHVPITFSSQTGHLNQNTILETDQMNVLLFYGSEE